MNNSIFALKKHTIMKTTRALLILASLLLTSCEHTEMCITTFEYVIEGNTTITTHCELVNDTLRCDSVSIVKDVYTSDGTITFDMDGTDADFDDVEGTVIYEIDEDDYQVTVTKTTSCHQ